MTSSPKPLELDIAEKRRGLFRKLMKALIIISLLPYSNYT
jgi:hypothetical protein